MFFFSFLAPSKWVRPALGACADPNAEVDMDVRRANPNGQKADKIAVRLDRRVGVDLRCVHDGLRWMAAMANIMVLLFPPPLVLPSLPA